MDKSSSILWHDYAWSVTTENEIQCSSSCSHSIVFITVTGLIYKGVMLKILGDQVSPFQWLDDTGDYDKW